jgi:hypothetical protein
LNISNGRLIVALVEESFPIIQLQDAAFILRWLVQALCAHKLPY